MARSILLISGDKTGDDRFHEERVPRADAIFDVYLAAQAAAKKVKKS